MPCEKDGVELKIYGFVHNCTVKWISLLKIFSAYINVKGVFFTAKEHSIMIYFLPL